MKYGKPLVVVYKHDNDNNHLTLLPSPLGTVYKVLYEVLFSRSIVGDLFRCYLSLIILIISTVSTFDYAEARHRRRSHARPEIHHSLRHADVGVRPIGQCYFTPWVEGFSEPTFFPNATGSAIVELGGYPWTLNGFVQLEKH